MRTMISRFRLPAVVCSALALSASLPAQTKIGVEGAISAISGTKIELYNGLVKFEVPGARIDKKDPGFKNIADLKVGTFIDVEARLERDGAMRATRIKLSDEKDRVPEVAGVIGTVDAAAQSFTIGPLTIFWTSGTKQKDPSKLRAGIKVEAQINFASGKLVAEVVEKD